MPLEHNFKNAPRIKDIKSSSEGYRFSKQNLENLVRHINTCEEWIEGAEKELKQIHIVSWIKQHVTKDSDLIPEYFNILTLFIEKEILGES